MSMLMAPLSTVVLPSTHVMPRMVLLVRFASLMLSMTDWMSSHPASVSIMMYLHSGGALNVVIFGRIYIMMIIQYQLDQ